MKNALVFLMESKDFKKITITDIVTTADLNRGTFYKHYQSQDELLNELIDDVMEDLIRAFKEPYLHTEKFIIGELTTSTVKIFEHVAAYSNFYTIIINSNALPGFQNKICDTLIQLMQQDLSSLVNVDHTISTDLLSSYNAYALFGLIIAWVKGGYKYTPKHMAEQLIEILTYNHSRAVIITADRFKSSDAVLDNK